MTAGEFRAIRLSLGLTQAETAKLLGLGIRLTITRYENGTRAVPQPIARLMLLLRDNKEAHPYLARLTSQGSSRAR